MFTETRLRNAVYLFRGLLLKYYLKLHGCQVGKRLKVKRWPVFRTIPRKNIRIGDYVTIGFFITFDPSHTGFIRLENRVNLTQLILISSASEVVIGAHSLIAENVSIRDGDHGTGKDSIIASQEITSAPITIGEDVWIGAHTMVLKGATVEKGAIIGASSVVTRSSVIRPYTIYAGNPLREIGVRR